MGIARKIVAASKAKVTSLENSLDGILQPIAPRREFVRGLGRRIQTVHRPAIVGHFTNMHFFLLIIAGVISFSVLVAMMMRALLALLGLRRRAQRQV